MKLLTKAIFISLLGAGAVLYADGKPDEGPKAIASLQVEIEDNHQTVLRLQEKARANKDPIQLNCINDKVVLMNGHLKIVDLIVASADTSLTELQDQAKNIALITEDAKGCVDSKRLSTETNNSFNTDGLIPTVNDDDGHDDDGHDLENPGYASPDD